MNKDKHIFINYRLFLVLTGLLFGILFIASTLEFGDKYSNEIGIMVIVILAIFLVLGIIFVAHYCVITPEGVEIGCFFGAKASAEWQNIKTIYKVPGHFGVFNADEYVFVGLEFNHKYHLFQEHFYVSKKMTKLIEQYAKNKLEK